MQSRDKQETPHGAYLLIDPPNEFSPTQELLNFIKEGTEGPSRNHPQMIEEVAHVKAMLPENIRMWAEESKSSTKSNQNSHAHAKTKR